MTGGAALEVLLLGVLAAGALGAAWYAHRRIGAHSQSSLQAALTRAVLIAVGIALGVTVVALYPAGGLARALVFLSGFGAVHVPAAGILWLKDARRAP